MTALYILLGIILLIIILGMIAPKEMKSERSTVISKPQQEVFNVVRSLKKQNEWSTWAKKDPDMLIEYRGVDGEVGSVSSWKGNKKSGEGEQEIKMLKPNDYVETELRFIKPWQATNTGYFNLQPDSAGTKVTWGFRGKIKFPMSVFALFMNMDKMIGKDFEEGLSNLKGMMEK